VLPGQCWNIVECFLGRSETRLSRLCNRNAGDSRPLTATAIPSERIAAYHSSAGSKPWSSMQRRMYSSNDIPAIAAVVDSSKVSESPVGREFSVTCAGRVVFRMVEIDVEGGQILARSGHAARAPAPFARLLHFRPAAGTRPNLLAPLVAGILKREQKKKEALLARAYRWASLFFFFFFFGGGGKIFRFLQPLYEGPERIAQRGTVGGPGNHRDASVPRRQAAFQARTSSPAACLQATWPGVSGKAADERC